MRIGVVYDFRQRGGDYVMLNMIKALSGDGHNLDLISRDVSKYKEALQSFGFDYSLGGLEYVNINPPSILPHPYSVAYIAKRVEKGYDLLLLSDDIPKNLSTDVISYIHYPHAARIRLDSLVENKYKNSESGKMKWFIHKHIFPKFFYVDGVPSNITLLANSTLTKRDTVRVLDPDNLSLVYPPVKSSKIHNMVRKRSITKENIATFIGKFQPEKNIEDIIKTAKILSDEPDLKFKLLGFLDNEKYFRSLVSKIRGLGIEGSVELYPNADRETCIEFLSKSKFYIHPTPSEPFGISVVEGMAAGCLPIVKKGFNGPWVDILNRGEYGHGYEDPQNLAGKLKEIINGRVHCKRSKVVNRALKFDESNFKDNFLEVIESFLKK